MNGSVAVPDSRAVQAWPCSLDPMITVSGSAGQSSPFLVALPGSEPPHAGGN
ncbi:unnamed protein product [Gulo gulo]|uniref:Uncharacterized protein n=1 Tax=Gulo gulo TaxID=48420 RepID=A0A9X9LIF9_GULGU|nr:unnamed protein product [Gulo gulo]